MLDRLSRLFKRNRDPVRMREEAENRLSAQQELRQAEGAQVRGPRGLEGAQKGLPYGRP